MGEYKWNAFVSHNSKHKAWVRKMVSQWRSLGLSVFFDEDSIDPGEDIVSGLERGLRGSRYIVFIISPAAVNSRWVAMEIACGLYQDPDSSKRKIIPILIEPTPFESIRLAVQRLRMIDLTDSSRRTPNYQYLLHFLGVRSEPIPGPPDSHKSVPVKPENSACSHKPSQETPLHDHSGGVPKTIEVWPVEITIDRMFEEYTPSERERLLKAIGEILDVTGRITVVSQRPGTVLLTIELPSDKAETLVDLALADSGVLQAYNVTDVRILWASPEWDTSSEQHRSVAATKKLFTTAEAATICRVSQQSIIRCFDAGQMKGFRIPGSKFRRIPFESLIRFMKENNIPLDRLDSGKKKILLVEDDAEVIELLTDVLTRDGRFEVKTASNGYEAGISTEQFRPDVILLDYMLPDVNVKAVCQAIGRNPELEKTRIIIVSGVVKQDEIEELSKAGAKGFIKKPFDVSELINTLSAVLLK
jgi:CheY-like chemotaxis protein